MISSCRDAVDRVFFISTAPPAHLVTCLPALQMLTIASVGSLTGNNHRHKTLLTPITLLVMLPPDDLFFWCTCFATGIVWFNKLCFV